MSAAPVVLKLLKILVTAEGGPHKGYRSAFEKSTLSIGRGPENDIVLAEDVKVSRHHVEIHVLGAVVTAKNVSSRNAMAVDGQVVTEKVLHPGAVIRVGDSELKIHFESPVEQPRAAAPVALAAAPSSDHVPIKIEPIHTPAESHAKSPARPRAGAPGPAGPAWSAPKRAAPGGSKLPMFVLVAVLLVVAYYFSREQIRKRNEIRLRDSVQAEVDITKSQNEYDRVAEEIEKKGKDTVQYNLAQEHYLRGFRDYRQGQYLRAMEGFQAALSFAPTHELARKYFALAKRKFDEQVQFNMIQGKRYYGLGNYRLCMGFYSNVIKMKKDPSDPVRREAYQYYKECEIKMRGKY